jgi:hypothetical protein
MSEEKIQELEEKIYKLGCELRSLRKAEPGVHLLAPATNRRRRRRQRDRLMV